ncbi:GFA family protein [Pelagicoccus mobilis]|uniref:GFA family protein n=1 Tax=Pelagicoccus mobilis TaxID=415221 RepID=A0A934RVT4_9BACT|nr:GFA family protein [Pelagicoccus mobilis]MBK1877406.1 GFA family protein [Pelagicoccus mobilis]
MSDPILGGCYCGKIRFEANPPVLYQAYCHCDNCRKAIGAQVVAWITVESSKFKYTQGTPKTYHTETTADRTFCPDCGSSLTYVHPDRSTHVDIVTGSLDHPECYPPNRDVFPEEKLPWISLCNQGRA